MSYLNPGMERYTARHTARQEIRHILVEEEGVLTVAPDSVKFFTRGGLLKSSCRCAHVPWSCPSSSYSHRSAHSTEQMSGLSCACVNNRSRHEILLGGESAALYSYDLEKGRILKEVRGVCVRVWVVMAIV